MYSLFFNLSFPSLPLLYYCISSVWKLRLYVSYLIFKHQILLGKPCYFSFILFFPTSSPLVTQKESLSPYFLLQCWHVRNFQFYVIIFVSVMLFVNEGSCYVLCCKYAPL